LPFGEWSQAFLISAFEQQTSQLAGSDWLKFGRHHLAALQPQIQERLL
jgi:hypothetical protein